MNRSNQYINAFTLTELAITMLIISIVGGLMFSSVFFIYKWKINYRNFVNQYEDIYEFVTEIKTDIFFAKEITFNNKSIEFINVSNDTVSYLLEEDYITRKQNIQANCDTLFVISTIVLSEIDKTNQIILRIDNKYDNQELVYYMSLLPKTKVKTVYYGN